MKVPPYEPGDTLHTQKHTHRSRSVLTFCASQNVHQTRHLESMECFLFLIVCTRTRRKKYTYTHTHASNHSHLHPFHSKSPGNAENREEARARSSHQVRTRVQHSRMCGCVCAGMCVRETRCVRRRICSVKLAEEYCSSA